jgi:MFS family permease
MAVFSAVAGGGAAIGLLLGGVLIQYLSWRYCMYVNVVFAAVAGGGALAVLREPATRTRPRLDAASVIPVRPALPAASRRAARAPDRWQQMPRPPGRVHVAWRDVLGSLLGRYSQVASAGRVLARLYTRADVRVGPSC